MNAMQPPQVRLGEWISEGWGMFTAQWKGWVVNSLVYLLLVGVPMAALYLLIFLPAMLSPEDPTAAFVLMPFVLIGIFVISLLSIIPMAGMFHSAFKQAQGGRVEVSDLWAERGKFPRLLGAALLIGLLYLAGALLCFIPGLLVLGLFQFTLPLIIDRNMGIGEAMRASKEVTRPNLVMFTVFVLVVALIGSAGAYACYIGLLATMPLQFTMIAAAYKNIFGLSGAAGAIPPANFMPPPYAAPGQDVYAPPPAFNPPSPAAGTATCPSCQATIPPTAVFCPRCGTPVR